MKRIIGTSVLLAFLLTGCGVSPSITTHENVPNSNSLDLFPIQDPPSPISLQNLDPNFVRAVAGRLLWEEYESLPSSPSKIRHVLSPTFPKEIQEGTLEAWQIGSNLFNDVSDLSNTFVFWTTPADSAWVNKSLCEEANYCDTGKSFYFNVGEALAKSGCEFLGGELRMGKSNLVVECIDPEKSGPYDHLGTHEYAHFVEMETFNDMRYTSWWTEGTATYFSFFIWAIKDDNYDTYHHGIAGMDFTLKNQEVYEVPDNPTVEDYEHMLDLVDDNPTQNAWSIGYYLGALSVEALIASFGVDAVKNHYALVGEIGWKKAFKQSFGVTTDEFRKIIAPYLKARHDLDKGL